MVEKDGDSRLELAMPVSEVSCRDGDPLRYRSELDSKVICAELEAGVVEVRTLEEDVISGEEAREMR